MTKPTWRFRSLSKADVEAAVRSERTLTAAAARLGVNKSTIARWVKAGWVGKGGKAKTVARTKGHAAGAAAPRRGESAKAWARRIRRRYSLSSSESVLLDLTERALSIAQDDGARYEVQLAAMARFQALLKQLNLPEESDGEVEEPAQTHTARWPRAVS